MRPQELIRLLRAQPFCRLRLHHANGQSYVIDHPEMAVVERSIVWLQFPGSGLPGLEDRRPIFITLVHILWGEFIEPSGTPSRNGPGQS
jgi:hypothetical protein